MNGERLYIIDPIHDFISASCLEREIIDAPAFQRLRRIRQLSGAHLTYPGAQHTRFEHSLGVMHIAGQAASILEERGIMEPDGTAALRLAGLLHDIGHGPFSHLFEELLQGSGTSHEEMGARIIRETEIGDLLSGSIHDRDSIIRLAFGDTDVRYMGEVISGVLSADMMDYLQRDGYFTGAEHARIDHKRIIQSLDVHRGRLAIEGSALYSFESMMYSRYQMFRAVYFHKTVRAAEVMMLESMRLAAGELGLASPGTGEYLELTDGEVLSRLLALKGGGELGRARELAADYRDRRLPKCVYEMPLAGGLPGGMDAGELGEELAKRSGAEPADIFVDRSTAPSIPLAPSKKESKSIILVSREGGTRTAREIPLSEVPLVSAMSGYMNILRVYAAGGARKKVEIAARSVLGVPE